MIELNPVLLGFQHPNFKCACSHSHAFSFMTQTTPTH